MKREPKMAEDKPKEETKKKTVKSEIAVILIRSLIDIRPDARKTLELLKLGRRNVCAIIPDSPNMRGMLQIIKDYTTWGEITPETKKILIDKRSKKEGQKVFLLNSPVKGYGRKGIKVPFTKGGSLGNRKDKINDLIIRMM